VNPRENRRPPLRIALFAAVILIIGYLAVKVYPFTRHRPVAKRMEVTILRLSKEVPAGLTEEQWAYCIVYTWMLHGNFGSMPSHVPTDDLIRIERGLQEKIDQGADLATIDWVWNQYIKGYPRARHFDHFRPTAPNNKTDFEAGNHGGNPLSQWRADYERRVTQQ
jgi:hypothetical protein